MGNCCSSPKAEDSEKHEVKQAGTGAKEDRAGRENLKTLSSKGPRGFDGLKVRLIFICLHPRARA